MPRSTPLTATPDHAASHGSATSPLWSPTADHVPGTTHVVLPLRYHTRANEAVASLAASFSTGPFLKEVESIIDNDDAYRRLRALRAEQHAAVEKLDSINAQLQAAADRWKSLEADPQPGFAAALVSLETDIADLRRQQAEASRALEVIRPLVDSARVAAERQLAKAAGALLARLTSELQTRRTELFARLGVEAEDLLTELCGVQNGLERLGQRDVLERTAVNLLKK